MNTSLKAPSIKVTNPWLSGLLYAMIWLGAGTLTTSLLLAMTSANEQSLPIFVYIVHGIAIWIGGIIAGKRSGSRGWYYGGSTGIIYALIILFVGFLSFNTSLTIWHLALLFFAFIIGAFGGMIGVNASK